MEIQTIIQDHFSEVAEIYRQGLATGMATFQNEVPSWEEWDRAHLAFCRMAASENNKILGWAALTPVSARTVYAGVAEVSIYLAEGERGKGIGTMLLNALIGQSEANGIWTLQSGIFSENKGSIRLHEKCGFRQVGYRERIAKKNGIWKDTVLMERRSKITGTD
ncbi:N-acetyltransferase family protein [uncultured Chryseobacterium sp.]|uniref:GNAT family N-acetyltransferase n=1 Tax=uncultured Chryseobacterium sp. TaxID=259322 RepID=UPI002600AFEC|nr:N-acetyltransferase family protein [uncultured Chryseobacterium sp.]